MNVLTMRQAINGAGYGLNGPIYARKRRTDQWFRVYGAQKRGEAIYGRDLASGWHEIYDWLELAQTAPRRRLAVIGKLIIRWWRFRRRWAWRRGHADVALLAGIVRSWR